MSKYLVQTTLYIFCNKKLNMITSCILVVSRVVGQTVAQAAHTVCHWMAVTAGNDPGLLVSKLGKEKLNPAFIKKP